MKRLIGVLIFLLLAVTIPATADTTAELYVGHSVNAWSPVTSDHIGGFSWGTDHFRAGAGRFGESHFGLGMIQTDYDGFFAGFGMAYVDHHENLDGNGQIVLSMGYRVGDVVLRWMHMGNGAAFNGGGMDDILANVGVDFVTVGFVF